MSNIVSLSLLDLLVSMNAEMKMRPQSLSYNLWKPNSEQLSHGSYRYIYTTEMSVGLIREQIGRNETSEG